MGYFERYKIWRQIKRERKLRRSEKNRQTAEVAKAYREAVANDDQMVINGGDTPPVIHMHVNVSLPWALSKAKPNDE
jgi:hypothetical protein